MKKILIFNGYYYPSKNCGGPITSIENIINACSDEFEFYVICYNHDFGDMTEFAVNTNIWVKVGKANVMYVKHGYLDFSLKHMGCIFEDLLPDLIWFSGVLTPNNKLVTVKLARRMNIPILFSPRGEVSADRVKLKAYKKIPYLMLLKCLKMYRNCYFHATSDDEVIGIKKYFKPDEKHIFKVANISIALQDICTNSHKNKDQLKLFFFSRIHEVKNLLFAIKCVNQCKTQVSFDIYGPIESESYWKECLVEIKRAPENITIKYGGILDYTNKTNVLQEHHCFLFPTINENFGHVIAESLANSRPVILSKGTTPWDDLDGKAGFVIPLEYPELFTEKIDYLASLNQLEFNSMVNSTRQYFRDKTMDDDAIIKHKVMFRRIINN